MPKLEQIAAIFLAAGLAIPSYWFFWTLAGGGGYDRREAKEILLMEKTPIEIPVTGHPLP
tara:strand:+ start:4496 stop:4675 length:180 start_codon:yes stop_codon:yes gene_type:complete